MIEEYNQEGVNAIATAGRPIPGQSLASSPDEPRPFEQPPEFTEFRKAFNYLAEELLEPEIYEGLVTGIGQGVPITDVTLQILQAGFQEGKWNPDLMMMLAEPTTYMLMALAERADIDFKVYKGEEEDEDAEATLFNIDIDKQKLKELRSVSKSQKIPKGMIPKEIEEQIEELPASSLLSKPEEEEPADSLLGRTST